MRKKGQKKSRACGSFFHDSRNGDADVERLRPHKGLSLIHIFINVDGGINAATAPLCAKAGADVLVAGSAVFGAPDPAAAMADIRRACEEVRP